MSALTESEIREIRRELPALERFTYFATNGLGVLPERSVAAAHKRLQDLSRKAILVPLFEDEPLAEETRQRVGRLLNCDADEIAFCRNTTEGILWVAHSIDWQAGDEVLVAQGEYPATVLPWMALEQRGVVTRLLPQEDRRITPAMVADAWSARARLLAVSFVQYNSGFRADLRGLVEVVHGRGGLVLCDAIQGIGALRFDARATGVDFVAAGTHKWLLGLQGLGIFYCARERLGDLEPLHVGPGSLPDDTDPDDPDAPYDRNFVPAVRRFEEGSRNYIGMAVLNESLKFLEEIGADRIEARVRELTDYAVAEAVKRGCRVESPREEGEWSGILLLAPPVNCVRAEALMAAMHKHRISINAREGCIHMGVHFYNTHEEVDRVMQVIDENRQPA